MSSDHQDMKSSEARALLSLMEEGITLRDIIGHLAPGYHAPPGTDDMMLWRMVVSLLDPPKRTKLSQYNTIQDAIELINRSKKIVVLSGAGISTSAGLPDFRSRNGIYVQINAKHPDLHDPKLMFDIEYFRKNPSPFYQFAKALFPGQYKPTIGHKFIKCIEDNGKLLRNYTQNIDTLERQAGIKKIVECHGSFSKATCTSCRYVVDGDCVRDDILSQKIPLCPKCHSEGNEPEDGMGVMKPNIVFFGEQLGDEFHRSLEEDKDQADLLIVIGSSLKVRPVALIPKHVPPQVPQILINKEPLDHMGFDIELLGDCDDIIQELCLRLGSSWMGICEPGRERLEEVIGIPPALMQKSLESVNNGPAGELLKRPQTYVSKGVDSEIEAERDDVSMSSVNVEGNTDEPQTVRETTEEFTVVGQSPEDETNCKQQRSEQTDDAIQPCDDNGDELDEVDNEQNNDDENDYDDGTEEWEELGGTSSSESSSTCNNDERALLEIPKSCYLFLKPSRFLFRGAELTKSQLSSHTKECSSVKGPERNPT